MLVGVGNPGRIGSASRRRRSDWLAGVSLEWLGLHEGMSAGDLVAVVQNVAPNWRAVEAIGPSFDSGRLALDVDAQTIVVGPSGAGQEGDPIGTVTLRFEREQQGIPPFVSDPGFIFETIQGDDLVISGSPAQVGGNPAATAQYRWQQLVGGVWTVIPGAEALSWISPVNPLAYSVRRQVRAVSSLGVSNWASSNVVEAPQPEPGEGLLRMATTEAPQPLVNEEYSFTIQPVGGSGSYILLGIKGLPDGLEQDGWSIVGTPTNAWQPFLAQAAFLDSDGAMYDWHWRGVVMPEPFDGIVFGAHTAVGQGGAPIDAPDGTYASGQFEVAGGIIAPAVSPLTPGTYTVGNTAVRVDADWRTFANGDELYSIVGAGSAPPHPAQAYLREGVHELPFDLVGSTLRSFPGWVTSSGGMRLHASPDCRTMPDLTARFIYGLGGTSYSESRRIELRGLKVRARRNLIPRLMHYTIGSLRADGVNGTGATGVFSWNEASAFAHGCHFIGNGGLTIVDPLTWHPDSHMQTAHTFFTGSHGRHEFTRCVFEESFDAMQPGKQSRFTMDECIFYNIVNDHHIPAGSGGANNFLLEYNIIRCHHALGTDGGIWQHRDFVQPYNGGRNQWMRARFNTWHTGNMARYSTSQGEYWRHTNSGALIGVSVSGDQTLSADWHGREVAISTTGDNVLTLPDPSTVTGLAFSIVRTGSGTLTVNPGQAEIWDRHNQPFEEPLVLPYPWHTRINPNANRTVSRLLIYSDGVRWRQWPQAGWQSRANIPICVSRPAHPHDKDCLLLAYPMEGPIFYDVPETGMIFGLGGIINMTRDWHPLVLRIAGDSRFVLGGQQFSEVEVPSGRGFRLVRGTLTATNVTLETASAIQAAVQVNNEGSVNTDWAYNIYYGVTISIRPLTGTPGIEREVSRVINTTMIRSEPSRPKGEPLAEGDPIPPDWQTNIRGGAGTIFGAAELDTERNAAGGLSSSYTTSLGSGRHLASIITGGTSANWRQLYGNLFENPHGIGLWITRDAMIEAATPNPNTPQGQLMLERWIGAVHPGADWVNGEETEAIGPEPEVLYTNVPDGAQSVHCLRPLIWSMDSVCRPIGGEIRIYDHATNTLIETIPANSPRIISAHGFYRLFPPETPGHWPYGTQLRIEIDEQAMYSQALRNGAGQSVIVQTLPDNVWQPDFLRHLQHPVWTLQGSILVRDVHGFVSQADARHRADTNDGWGNGIIPSPPGNNQWLAFVVDGRINGLTGSFSFAECNFGTGNDRVEMRCDAAGNLSGAIQTGWSRWSQVFNESDGTVWARMIARVQRVPGRVRIECRTNNAGASPVRVRSVHLLDMDPGDEAVRAAIFAAPPGPIGE